MDNENFDDNKNSNRFTTVSNDTGYTLILTYKGGRTQEMKSGTSEIKYPNELKFIKAENPRHGTYKGYIKIINKYCFWIFTIRNEDSVINIYDNEGVFLTDFKIV